MVRKFFLIFRDLSRQVSKQNISAFSASTAFFIYLSLIPMLIMICTMIPFTPLTKQNVEMAITDLTPDVFDPLIGNIISQVYEKSAGILSIAALVTVWSAGKGVLALIRGLNAINGVEEKRNYFRLRLQASFYTVVVLIMIVLLLLLMVFGDIIIAIILRKIPQLEVLFHIFVHFRFLVVWAVLTLVLSFLYAWIPDKRLRVRYQIPGAAFSAVGWSVFSWGFSIYLDYFHGTNAYGTLSIVILMMLWLYFGIYIVMLGAYLNRYFLPAYSTFYKRRKQKQFLEKQRMLDKKQNF